jgi:hypothetical protein
MSEPLGHSDKIIGVITEILAAQSALNMPPEPCSNAKVLGPYLSNQDKWAKHACYHLANALNCAMDIVKEGGTHRISS